MDDDKMNEIKNKVKTVLKSSGKRIIKMLLPVIIIIVLLASFVYFITIDDGTYKEDDWTSTPYAASQYTSSITVNNDGTISGSMTAQELWDKMLEEGSRVNLYLDSPEELLKLMNAEVITQFPDLREDTTKEIDWNEINKKVDESVLQGIIKFKRADSDGNTYTMTYVDPDTFQSYIDEYNDSGSQSAKQNALKHFTLGSTTTTIGSGAGIITGNGSFTKYEDLTDSQIRAIANLCKQEQGSVEGAAAEASLMANRFELYGSSFGSGGSGLYNYVRTSGWFANAPSHMDNGSATDEYVEVVKAVLVNGKRTVPGYVDEHDCFSDISSATNNGSAINVSERSAYKQNITKIKNVYDSNYTFYCFPTSTSDPFGYISEENRNRIGDAYYDFDTGELVNGEDVDNSENDGDAPTLNEWKWPTDGTNITSYFGPREAPLPGASTDHGAIDIGVPTGTNVYACDSGKVITASYAGDAGNLVTIDHGNGYVTKYMHNSELKVSVGDTVQKGQVIALSGSTGNSTGPHVHFQVEYNGTKVDPLTFTYENGMGDGTASPTSGTSTASQYYAIVATWNEVTDIMKTNDPDEKENEKNSTTYRMSTTPVNYQELVSNYTMPFDYLWAMLVVSEDKDFVMDLADLVYNSQIEISVYDNLTTNENVKVYTYTKMQKTETTATVTSTAYPWDGYLPITSITRKTADVNNGEEYIVDEKEVGNYTTTYTNITKTNTLEISLTLADVWMGKYEQEYNNEVPSDVLSGNGDDGENLEDIDYPEEPSETTNNDTYGHGESLKNVTEGILKNILSERGGYIYSSYPLTEEECMGNINYYISSTKNVTEKIYRYKYTNRNEKNTNTLKKNTYVSSPMTVTEKTDKDSEEPNFVTIFLDKDNSKAKNNILSVESWLFEILEENDSTKNLVDLTKYLLYKATGTDYGVTEYDFEALYKENYQTITGTLYGTTVEEKVWFALRDAGFSEYAVAGTMGNIYAESRFDPSIIEGGSGIGFGLCQWSYGRRTQLEAYAASKGKSASDVNIQIEFLLTEITPGAVGPAQGYADYQLLSYNGYNGDMWENAISPEDAAVAFCWSFERPGEPNLETRKTKAREYYELFKGKTKPSFSGETIVAAGYEFPHYYQRDWSGAYGTSTIAASGCGPTSLAMILAGVTGNPSITPQTVVDALNDYWPDGSYYVPGSGSSHCIFTDTFINKYFGVSSELSYPNESQALAALEAGNCLIGGEDGHILAIIPAPDEYKAQGYKFYILDSARGHDGPYRSVSEANDVVKGNLSFIAIIKP